MVKRFFNGNGNEIWVRSVLVIITLLCMPLTTLAITLPVPDLQKAIYTIKELPIVGSIVSTKLFWQVEDGLHDDEIDGFMVYRNNSLWKRISVRSAQTRVGCENGYGVTDQYYIWDRDKNKTYTYQVCAFKGKNTTNLSDAKLVKIVEKDTVGPSAPSNLRILNKGIDFVKIGWDISLDDRVCSSSIIRERLFGIKPEKNLDYRVIIDGKENNKIKIKNNDYAIHGLLPGKNYNVSVIAYDFKGNPSKPSANVSVCLPGTVGKTDTKNLDTGKKVATILDWLRPLVKSVN